MAEAPDAVEVVAAVSDAAVFDVVEEDDETAALGEVSDDFLGRIEATAAAVAATEEDTKVEDDDDDDSLAV